MPQVTRPQRRSSTCTYSAQLVAAGLLACPGAQAGGSALAPDAMFVQAGAASDARTLTVGLQWDGTWSQPLARGRLTLHWEAAFGRWRSEIRTGDRTSAWVTQLGLTPTLRWQAGGPAPRWFLDAGIGVNVLFPVYRSGDKQFSTTFNFGDHIAVGRRFGVAQRHELALRVQHYSNAGIKRPNPGEDFVQLRWVRRL